MERSTCNITSLQKQVHVLLVIYYVLMPTNPHACLRNIMLTVLCLYICVICSRPGANSTAMLGGGGLLQRCTTISHIEHQLSCCTALQSVTEYKFWMNTYVRYLAQEGSISEKSILK